MQNVSDLVGASPAIVEPVADITPQTVDPVGEAAQVPAMDVAPAKLTELEAAFVEASKNPPDLLPNLEGALAAAENAAVVIGPDSPQLFWQSTGTPPAVRVAPEAKPKVEHKPQDENGFKYAWQRNRFDGRRF